MHTSFPDLPFTCGNVVHGGSNGTTTKPDSKYPRTDLQTLTHWTSFPSDIHCTIQSAVTRAHLSSVPFNISGTTRSRTVRGEATLCTHAAVALHYPVEDVLAKLGIEGEIVSPGGVAIVGGPDFIWAITDSEELHPKFAVEYKTWWTTDLADLPAIFEHKDCDTRSQHSLAALHQIYGYMTFNNHRFGILTNWRHTLLLRRTQTSDGKALEYYLVELGGPISMLKAWVGMILLSEDNWLYAYPNASPPTPQSYRNLKITQEQHMPTIDTAQGGHMLPINGQYPCLTLDFRLCHFDLSYLRCGRVGCAVRGRFVQGEGNIHVIFKVVDILRYPDAADSLDDEALTYATLQNLQGQAIPRVYGVYEVWGILRLLALEPVGNAIPADEQIDQTLRIKMKATLKRIHDAGFVHGDITRRNFCRMESGDIFLVDLEACRRYEEQSEPANEMSQVDVL